MNTTNISATAVWIDSVSAPQTVYEPYLLTALGERQLSTFRPSRPVSTTRRSPRSRR
jgi:hypothetical protein